MAVGSDGFVIKSMEVEISLVLGLVTSWVCDPGLTFAGEIRFTVPASLLPPGEGQGIAQKSLPALPRSPHGSL